jgi:hypothetical protein
MLKYICIPTKPIIENIQYKPNNMYFIVYSNKKNASLFFVSVLFKKFPSLYKLIYKIFPYFVVFKRSPLAVPQIKLTLPRYRMAWLYFADLRIQE